MTKANDTTQSAWERISEILRPLAIEYNEEVRDLAKQIRAEAKEYSRDIEECLHETIDGHNWVIYTYKARLVALISDSYDAHVDEFGSGEPATPEMIAYCALAADVREAIGNLEDQDEDDESDEDAADESAAAHA